MGRKISFILFFLFLTNSISAQKVNNGFQINCNRSTSEIVVDGVLDEATWINADVAGDFHMITPMDTALAEAKTEVRVAYDDKNFYISAVCYIQSPR
ncbi:MAG: hypothetical protein U5K79_12625 [Cyclobacteriaceae bacterium]|nr:hypothetical protein [Cyclobacteriaceae bacterium]